MKAIAPRPTARGISPQAVRAARYVPVVAPLYTPPVVVQPMPVSDDGDLGDWDAADEAFDGGWLDILGADAPEDQPQTPEGGSWADAIRAAGDVGLAAYQAYQTTEAAKASTASEKAKLAACVAADVSVALADAAAAGSAEYAASMPAGKLKQQAVARAAKDKAALATVLKAQEAAAAELPPSQSEARARAAGAALDATRLKLKLTPDSETTQRLVKAWESVLTKAQNAQIVKPEGTSTAPSETPAATFWERKYGPFTVAQCGVGGSVIAALGLAAVVLRRR
jgi:hypothetical protein